MITVITSHSQHDKNQAEKNLVAFDKQGDHIDWYLIVYLIGSSGGVTGAAKSMAGFVGGGGKRRINFASICPASFGEPIITMLSSTCKSVELIVSRKRLITVLAVSKIIFSTPSVPFKTKVSPSSLIIVPETPWAFMNFAPLNSLPKSFIRPLCGPVKFCI